MINFNDDVPHVPPRDWGFQQSSGEVWILQGGTTYESCSGQENAVSRASYGGTNPRPCGGKSSDPGAGCLRSGPRSRLFPDHAVAMLRQSRERSRRGCVSRFVCE